MKHDKYKEVKIILKKNSFISSLFAVYTQSWINYIHMCKPYNVCVLHC